MWAMVRSTTWRIRLMLLLASFAASLSSPLGGFLRGVIIPLPTYPLKVIQGVVLKEYSASAAVMVCSNVSRGLL